MYYIECALYLPFVIAVHHALVDRDSVQTHDDAGRKHLDEVNRTRRLSLPPRIPRNAVFAEGETHRCDRGVACQGYMPLQLLKVHNEEMGEGVIS